MKLIAAAIMCCISFGSSAAVQPFNKSDHDRYMKSKYENYQVDNSHREIIQEDLNRSVAMQNEVDKILRQNAGKINHVEFCKAISIYQSMDYKGDIQPAKYLEIYEYCLKQR